MEPTTIAEQRATAVAMLKRAASLPRMKDGRRPPMHVEAVSEGEGNEKVDQESAQDSDEKPGTPEVVDVAERVDAAEAEAELEAAVAAVEAEKLDEQELEGQSVNKPDVVEDKSSEALPPDCSPERPSTPARKRRSRSRARSRGSKDLRVKTKTPPPANNESSADEYVADDHPPSPPLISPIPSHFAGFQSSRFLRSPISPIPGMFYPVTSPSTPMMPPSLDEIQKNIGLFRSNSVGAARMIAMSKLIGEPVESLASPSTPLGRSSTFSGGERSAARRMLFNKLRRPEKGDPDQTSGTDDLSRPATPARQRRTRSRRNSSRASAVLDDRDEREQTSTSPNTPLLPHSPLPPQLQAVAVALAASSASDLNRTPVQHQPDVSMPMGGRGVVIEDEDEDADRGVIDKSYVLPTTPARRDGKRIPHSSDAPSQLSNESLSAIPVPFFLSTHQAHKQDGFPASPFATPLREKTYLDDDEESDAYRELRMQSGSRQAFPRDSEISWVAEAVPLSRIPINDDDEEEEEEDELEHPADEAEAEEPQGEVHEPESAPQTEDAEGRPSDTRSSRSYYPASPSASGASKDLLIEIETSPELSPHIPPSPSSAIILSYGNRKDSSTPAPPSPGIYPRRLSVTTPVQQQEPSPLATEFQEWDDNRTEGTPKRANEGQSTWERVKGAFVRSNSTNGRRSRTNSIGRRYNTDSSVSRESGLSQGSASKGDRSSLVATPAPAPAPGLMQSPSASASILSLIPMTAPPGGVSPVPPVSSADLAKYQDSKLFPFPGMVKLEEKRKQAKGIGSASSPDIFSPTSVDSQPSSSSSSSATTKVPDGPRDRKLSHQASDTRLLAKFANGASPVSSAPSTGPHADYFSLNSATSNTSPVVTSGFGSLKLPTNREGVRKWLSAKKIFSSQSPAPSTPSTPAAAASVIGPSPTKKALLSDLGHIVSGREPELSDWEDIGSDKSRTPVSATSPSAPKRLGDQFPVRVPVEVSEHAKDVREAEAAQSPRVVHTNGTTTEIPALPSPPEPPSSATPDPLSSVDEDPAQSTSESLSSDISSTNFPEMQSNDPNRAGIIMERLEEALGRGSKSSIWPIAIDDPPRKLMLSSPVLQVANANTVKDRFVFIFSDILVIAKPILPDPNEYMDMSKPSVYERKFITKSVALLRDLKVCADRDDPRARIHLNASHMRHQVIRTFVHQFAKDPDMAITTLFDKSNMRVDPVALGQLLFHAIELDRARLGDYLARRTSKVVLKAYLDSFGFRGLLRIDKALRVFLLSISIPPKASLEHLLDAFATRWYEANSDLVVYDREVAIRLVRSIIQLNEVMHGGIAQAPGFTSYPKRNIFNRDFIDAFHRQDPRCSAVSAEALDRVYAAIRRERLSQARSTHGGGSAELVISMKRPIPSRLTYRIQSEPIILRIPQPDEHFTVQLFGEGLQIDPPYLTFTKSAEASFRLTATALGPKSVIMWRSGPHALLYSGLPLSSPVVVERAFMRNTFQVAFKNHLGQKRKYMFSVDDSVKHRSLIDTLKQQIEIAAQPPLRTTVESSPSSVRLRRAIETTAFRVLQDTLISSEDSSHVEQYSSPVDQALARLTGSPSSYGNGYLNASASNSHRRSKSRSQVYHRHGAGKLEPTLSDDDREDGFLRRDVSVSQRPGERLWTTNDLEVVCRQNSSLPQVLSYLHIEDADQAVS